MSGMIVGVIIAGLMMATFTTFGGAMLAAPTATLVASEQVAAPVATLGPSEEASPTITALQAMDAALAALPGGTIVEVDLKTKYGRLQWEVYVRTPDGIIEVYIDATTGEIIKQEPATEPIPTNCGGTGSYGHGFV